MLLCRENCKLEFLFNTVQLKKLLIRKSNQLICGFFLKMYLSAEMTNKILLIKINDDGCGFEIGSVIRGNGLNNMHLRANQSNVLLTINSGQGAGTEIIISYIPHCGIYEQLPSD